MNVTPKVSVLSAALLLLVGSVPAASYSDATGDGTIFAAWPHLDITSVDVTNDATNISFTIHLAGNPITVNWGEYQIGINSIPIVGATNFDVAVPNGRPITMSVGGMDYWIRSWNSGAESYHWDAGGAYWYGDWFTWVPPSDIQVPTKTASTVTLKTTLASLNLAVGDSFYFDVYTSGGTPTDSAVDALANPNATAAGGDWVSPYDSATNVYLYTVTGTLPVLTNDFGAAYSDATNDLLFASSGYPHLDIAAVDVTNDTENISFKIYLVGDPIAVPWGEYNVGIDRIPGTTAGSSVPPSRPIFMSAGGMDYWIRSWDNGAPGAEVYYWDQFGPYWALDSGTWAPPSNIQLPAKTTNSVTLTTTLASLGLTAGDSFNFDVYTTGGTETDSAVDALGNPNPTIASGDWVTPYDSGARVFRYSVGGNTPLAPLLSNPQKAGTTFTVAVPTQSGFDYVLEFKNALTDLNWTAAQTNSGTGGTITMSNTAVVAPMRWYRVRVQ